MKSPFKIYESDNKQFYYVHVGLNGKVLNTSETYKKKQSAWRGVYSVLKSLNHPIVEKRKSLLAGLTPPDWKTLVQDKTIKKVKVVK